MSELNEIDGGAIELNPDIARIQSAQQGVASQIAQIALPATGFVAAINGESGAITIQGSTSGGITINVTNGVGTVTIGISGLGTIVTHNQAAAVANSLVVAGIAYSQTDFQSVIDKLNALLTALRTAGIIAT